MAALGGAENSLSHEIDADGQCSPCLGTLNCGTAQVIATGVGCIESAGNDLNDFGPFYTPQDLVETPNRTHKLGT